MGVEIWTHALMGDFGDRFTLGKGASLIMLLLLAVLSPRKKSTCIGLDSE